MLMAVVRAWLMPRVRVVARVSVVARVRVVARCILSVGQLWPQTGELHLGLGRARVENKVRGTVRQ